MRIALITRDPAHPLLAAATALLTPEHDVVTLDPETAGRAPSRAPMSTCSKLTRRKPSPWPVPWRHAAPPW